MNETPAENASSDGSTANLFSPEELELMEDANGVAADQTMAPALDELQEQYNTVVRLVAEGGERERQLRAIVHDLTMLANANQQQHCSLHEQTLTLARIMISSSERELQLKQSLEEVRSVIGKRARTLM